MSSVLTTSQRIDLDFVVGVVSVSVSVSLYAVKALFVCGSTPSVCNRKPGYSTRLDAHQCCTNREVTAIREVTGRVIIVIVTIGAVYSSHVLAMGIPTWSLTRASGYFAVFVRHAARRHPLLGNAVAPHKLFFFLLITARRHELPEGIIINVADEGSPASLVETRIFELPVACGMEDIIVGAESVAC